MCSIALRYRRRAKSVRIQRPNRRIGQWNGTAGKNFTLGALGPSQGCYIRMIDLAAQQCLLAGAAKNLLTNAQLHRLMCADDRVHQTTKTLLGTGAQAVTALQPHAIDIHAHG